MLTTFSSFLIYLGVFLVPINSVTKIKHIHFYRESFLQHKQCGVINNDGGGRATKEKQRSFKGRKSKENGIEAYLMNKLF